MTTETPLTAEELDDLERIDKAATPGPWESRGACIASDLEPIYGSFMFEAGLARALANAKFTVSARNAFPSLIAMARRGVKAEAERDAAEGRRRAAETALRIAEGNLAIAHDTAGRRAQAHGDELARYKAQRDAALARAQGAESFLAAVIKALRIDPEDCQHDKVLASIAVLFGYMDEVDEAVAAKEAAEKAVEHALSAIRDDGRKAYLMGYGTQTFALLTAVHAARLGEDVKQFQERFWALCRPERVVPADDGGSDV